MTLEIEDFLKYSNANAGKLRFPQEVSTLLLFLKETILLKISCKRKSTQPWNTIQKTTLRFQGKFGGMMEKAEELGNKINDTNKPGEYYSDISEGMVTLELSGLSDNGEKLTITASGRFFDEYSWHSKNPEEVINRFKESLERFINIEEKVLTDEINLNNARSIWDNEEFEWSSGNKTPLDLYDYELTC